MSSASSWVNTRPPPKYFQWHSLCESYKKIIFTICLGAFVAEIYGIANVKVLKNKYFQLVIGTFTTEIDFMA